MVGECVVSTSQDKEMIVFVKREGDGASRVTSRERSASVVEDLKLAEPSAGAVEDLNVIVSGRAVRHIDHSSVVDCHCTRAVELTGIAAHGPPGGDQGSVRIEFFNDGGRRMDHVD